MRTQTGWLRRTAALVLAAFLVIAVVVGGGVALSLYEASGKEVPAEFLEDTGPRASAEPSRSAAPERPTAVVGQREARRTPEPRPSTAPELPVTAKKKAKPRVVVLRPVTALGSQRTIDKGKLVTWMTSPVCLLAGHNTMGWYWMDDLKTGTVVTVKTGPCRGTYKVYARKSQARKGGPVPGWMSDPKLDLVLQTCKTRGMGFSLLRRT